MNDPGTHAAWFADVRRILDIAEVTPGIPLPFISSDRVSFYFTAITHADDAAEAVSAAETILGYALGVTFDPPEPTEGAGIPHRAIKAYLPSGLLVALVAKAEHANPESYVARRVAAIREAVTETHAAIFSGSAA